jgi:cytochrome d ubiquinol oxidase subunit II
MRGEAATIGEARALGATFALSSVLVPFCLGATIGGIASGQVPATPDAGDPWTSWLNTTSVMVGALAVAVGAYLAAVFMAADSRRGGHDELVRAFRARALGAGAVAGAIAVTGLFVVREDAPLLYDGLTSGAGLAMVILSAVAGLVTLGLIWTWRLGAARWTSAIAVGAIVAGWGIAQRPDFLPGEMTLDAAAAGDATLVPLLIAIAAGLMILVPALALLFRLTLTGRLDP